MLLDRSSPAMRGWGHGRSHCRGKARFVVEPTPANPAGTRGRKSCRIRPPPKRRAGI